MNIHDTLFWFFSIAMLLSGCWSSPAASGDQRHVSGVGICFHAGLFVLLEAVFLAAIQVLVYAGAIMVLFCL